MNKEKHVDESWKEQAFDEKDKLADIKADSQKDSSNTQAGTMHRESSTENTATDKTEHQHDVEINFLNYVTSLGFQAMIFMGEIPNPITNKVEKNLAQAKFLIDTLSMLKEKTAGNLNDQEGNLLENSLYELQMRYVQLIQQEETSK